MPRALPWCKLRTAVLPALPQSPSVTHPACCFKDSRSLTTLYPGFSINTPTSVDLISLRISIIDMSTTISRLPYLSKASSASILIP
ncbi:hypothetical protein BDN70DRAFT_939641 [Pholiota conissans]|uniref:Uncharacterized protein n=1 Tax=Pholiota conissans TaxID=109636 RepID=A0A9P5YKM7_9AGAR|nr:hypothetical protein BDN70DRAFT_939641 [Pholiota conissans]